MIFLSIQASLNVKIGKAYGQPFDPVRLQKDSALPRSMESLWRGRRRIVHWILGQCLFHRNPLPPICFTVFPMNPLATKEPSTMTGPSFYPKLTGTVGYKQQKEKENAFLSIHKPRDEGFRHFEIRLCAL